MSTIPLSETAAKRRIGDILLDHGFVTADELAEATLEQERTQQPLGQILVGRGAITRLELASALAEQWSDPAASITAGPRPAPAPAPVPSAQDEAQYAARLQEAVADLARKVQSQEPVDGNDERVEELSRRIEGTLARTQHIEAAVATLAESLAGVTDGVEAAFYALQTGTAELVTDLARIEQTVGELASREAPAGDGPTLADLEEIRIAVAELSDRSPEPTALREQVEAIATRLESLGEPGTAVEDVARRIEAVGLQLDDLRARADGAPETEERLERLESRLEDLMVGKSELATRIDALADNLSDDSEADRGVADALAQIARLDALLARTTSNVDQVTATMGSHDHAAVERRLEDLAHAVEAVRGEIAAAGASEHDQETAERLGRLESRLVQLAGEADETRAFAAKLEGFEATLEHRVTTTETLVEDLRSDRLQDGQLSARVDALEQRPVEEYVTSAELAQALEGRLSQAPTEDGLLARLAELETARLGDLDTINVLAVAMDRIRHDLTAPRPPEGDEAPAVLEAVAALGERISALEGAPAATAAAPAHDDSEVLAELDRTRVVLERIGLHLGEHDRALADLGPSRGVEERLQELTVLVQDLAASQHNAGTPQASAEAGPLPADIGALLHRLEETETASQSDNEKLMNRLERMASSIDWRLQRLETDEPDDGG